MSSIRMSNNGQGPNGGTGGGGGGGGGGRKMNAANHLLNFSLPSRAERAVVPRRSRKGGGGEGARWNIFNKEKFVNASFRFMLKATGDYTVYFTDSDILFHWPDILQVLVPTPTPSLVRESSDEGRASSRSREPSLPSCPICLGVPVAPRMTRCGHIYCFSCVLHYLALSEEKYARCPICTDTIYSRDLKCVTWSPVVPEPKISPPPPSLGPIATTTPSHPPHSHPSNDHDHAEIPSDFEDLPPVSAPARNSLHQPSTYPAHIFRLIQRPQHTTLALPRSSTWPSSALLPHEAPFQFLPDVSTFARFMLATPVYLVGELERDVRQLDAEKREQKSAGEDGVGLGFIDAARGKVVEQISRAKAELETPGVLQRMKEVEVLLETLEKRGDVQRKREERSRVLLQASTNGTATSAILPPPPFFPSADAPSFIPSSLSINSSPSSSLPNGSAPTTATPIPHAFLNQLGHSWSSSSPTDPSNSTTVSAPATPYPSTSPTKSSLLNPNPRTNQRKPHLAPPPEPSFFFYQSYGGQQIYLHPLDIRVLLHEYKSYSAFPSLLKVGVEGAEEGTMNDDLRRRCKYLAHLPTGCSILFVETDLSTLVSPSTLAAFDAPLKQRRHRRRERGKREERDRRRAEAVEREKEGGGLDRRAPDDGRRGGGGWGGEGGDEFEEALERSLLESQGYEGDDVGTSSTSGSFPPHPTLSSSLDRTSSTLGSRPPPSSSPPSLGAWGARSFASALHTSSSSSSYGRPDGRRNEVDEEEVAALWRRFDAQEGERNRLDREGESSAGGSGGVPASSSNGGGGGGGKKLKKKGQKVLLTGGGRRG